MRKKGNEFLHFPIIEEVLGNKKKGNDDLLINFYPTLSSGLGNRAING